MTERTHIDEIVRYPDLALMELSKNKTFVSLLTDTYDADINDPAVMAKWNRCTNNYISVDEIITETIAFCCVDTRLILDGTQIVDAYIDLLIGVHKDIMSLRGTQFTGFSGNRRDNLIREAEYTLHKSRAFGVGELRAMGTVEPVKTANSPSFACKIIHFESSAFSESRNIRRG